MSVTNNGYGGLGFQSGGGAVSPTSSSFWAVVHAQLNYTDVTVIAWVNGNAKDLNPLPAGANPTLTSQLVPNAASCYNLLKNWVTGKATSISTQADRDYANAWLIKNSANSAPPSNISLATYLTADWRLFNDFGGNIFGTTNAVGDTPDPCLLMRGTPFGSLFAAGQPSTYNGQVGTSSSGKLYHVAEGRVGIAGQLGSQTINQGRTAPWIYSVIEFDSNGIPTVSDHATFPTYYVYYNGVLQPTLTVNQSTVHDFVYGYDSSNQLSWQPVP